MKLTKSAGLRGELSIPGDKSISHRAVMFGSLAKGTTHISNFLSGADCLSTIDCFRKMGVLIEQDGTNVTVHGNGLHGLKAPSETLDVGNSGTTTRLISGILAGQDFETVLSGDASLNKRPMGRIIKPLEQMGANETQEIMKQAIEAGVKVRELEAKVEELNKEREELKKEREAAIPSEKPEDAEIKFMRELGSKMAEMPEQGFLREFANGSDLNVVNSLGSITSKYARKSGIYDGAMKARFQGLTLAEDGVDDTFLQGTFKAGTDKNKAQTASKRSLRPQMAEAYLQMDKATVRGVNDSGALSEYVMSEMVNRVIQKVEHNMILGSADGSNGFYGLKTAKDGWTKQIEYTDLFEGITDAVAECSISDAITIVMSPQTFAELRKAKGTDGHSRFNELATKEQIAQSFGAVNLETRVWMPKDEVAVYNHDEYVLIGDLNVENYNDFDLRYNVEQWLSETLVGGSIRGKNRSAYLKKKGSLGV